MAAKPKPSFDSNAFLAGMRAKILAEVYRRVTPTDVIKLATGLDLYLAKEIDYIRRTILQFVGATDTSGGTVISASTLGQGDYKLSLAQRAKGNLPKFKNATWAPLSYSWYKRKSTDKKTKAGLTGDEFFIYTGQLEAAIRGTDFLKKLGGVTVSADIQKPKRLGSGRQIRSSEILAMMNFSLFPKLSAKNKQSVVDSVYDKYATVEQQIFGARAKIIPKLKGPAGIHRPLVVPVLSFWANFRLPKAIENFMRRRSRSVGANQ